MSDFKITIENKMHGFRTRLKELHYSSPSWSIHKIIDDFTKELDEFDDALMENMIALFGTIKPGDLNPELPEATEFESLLEDFRGQILVSIKREAADSMMWTGITNLVDGFFTTVNSYVYKIQIAKKELK